MTEYSSVFIPVAFRSLQFELSPPVRAGVVRVLASTSGQRLLPRSWVRWMRGARGSLGEQVRVLACVGEDRLLLMMRLYWNGNFVHFESFLHQLHFQFENLESGE